MKKTAGASRGRELEQERRNKDAKALLKNAEQLLRLSEQAALLAERAFALAESESENIALLGKRLEKERIDLLKEAMASFAGKGGSLTRHDSAYSVSFARENWSLLLSRIAAFSDISKKIAAQIAEDGPERANKLEDALGALRWAHLDKTVALWPLSMTTTGETWWLLESMTQSSLCWSDAWPHQKDVFLRLRKGMSPVVLRRIGSDESGSLWDGEIQMESESGLRWSIESSGASS